MQEFMTSAILQMEVGAFQINKNCERISSCLLDNLVFNSRIPFCHFLAFSLFVCYEQIDTSFLKYCR